MSLRRGTPWEEGIRCCLMPRGVGLVKVAIDMELTESNPPVLYVVGPPYPVELPPLELPALPLANPMPPISGALCTAISCFIRSFFCVNSFSYNSGFIAKNKKVYGTGEDCV